jgi:hypothetical protein
VDKVTWEERGRLQESEKLCFNDWLEEDKLPGEKLKKGQDMQVESQAGQKRRTVLQDTVGPGQAHTCNPSYSGGRDQEV